jgi:4-amino-4-deoxy-L-arabinose transferase-like glycosyltransferase
MLAAKLKDLSGASALYCARALSLLTFVLSCLVVRRLSLLVCSPLAAALAVLVYAVSALSIQWHAAPMPDNLAVLLSLAALWLHFESPSVGSPRFLLALLCAALATLIKPPVHFPVALAVGLASCLEHRLGALRDSKLLLHGAVALVAALAFGLAAKHLNSGTEKEESLAWFFGTFGQRLEAARWIAFPRRLLSVFGHPLLAPAFCFGSYRALRQTWASGAKPAERLVACWLVGNALAAFVFFNVYSIHNYYQLPLLPLYALLVAYGGEQALLALPRVAAMLRRFWPLSLAGALVFVAHTIQFTTWLPTLNYATNRELVALGRRLQAASQRDDQLLLVMRTPVEGPEMMYYAHRRGRVLGEQADAADVASALGAFLRRAGGEHWLAFATDVDAASATHWLAQTCGYGFERGPAEPLMYRVRSVSGATCAPKPPSPARD